jgi:P-type Ca2+ transporter type 2C
MPNQADNLNGLSSEVAAGRLILEGPNALPSPDRRSVWAIVFDVVREPMFVLLIMGGFVYLALGDRREALFLLFFGLFSVGITVVQESRSERVLEALRELSNPSAQVFRDAKRIQIPSRDVVREDLLLISEGNRVAADARLVTNEDLLLDESLLTGESVPVTKTVAQSQLMVAPTSTAIDQSEVGSSTVYAGTLVVRGTGLALVSATGLKTEIGKIGVVLNKIEQGQSPLRIQIRRLVLIFAILGVGVGLLTVLLYGLLRGSWLEALLAGLAIGMSMLPEEFPLVLAVFMAMGAWRISQANVLTRRSAAIEALGATSVLCTDKTGTLTENKMAVSAIRGVSESWVRGVDARVSDEVRRALTVARFACAQQPSDPMDLAIVGFLQENNTVKNDQPFGRQQVRTYGIRPELFAFTTVLPSLDGRCNEAYSKGALEAIAKLCKLSPERLQSIKQEADVLAASGVRVLGLAKATGIAIVDKNAFPESPVGMPFEYVGLIGFSDPLRADVPNAVNECRAAGIRVVMITGDYPITARAIAKQAGIESEKVLTGDEIDSLSDVELTNAVTTVSIFARIRPQQKLRLVESFKARREIVAMTGDGVNDAPAIKAAHIGIAMGERGSEVAREAAAIVLLHDDFGAIVKAVRLGRRIYDNLRKSVEYIIAIHIPIAGLTLVPLAFGLPLILTPIHIAFLEMVVDPACSVIFEAEREEDNVMNRPPRDTTMPLLPRKRVVWACVQGLISLTILVGLFLSAVFSGATEPDVRALVFTSLIFVNISLIFVNRSNNASIWRTLNVENRSFWVLFLGVCAMLAPMLLWSPARSMFRLGDFHGHDLAICIVASIVNIVILELIKSRWFTSHDKRSDNVGKLKS